MNPGLPLGLVGHRQPTIVVNRDGVNYRMRANGLSGAV
jgi:hypothetical protein